MRQSLKWFFIRTRAAGDKILSPAAHETMQLVAIKRERLQIKGLRAFEVENHFKNDATSAQCVIPTAFSEGFFDFTQISTTACSNPPTVSLRVSLSRPMRSLGRLAWR